MDPERIKKALKQIATDLGMRGEPDSRVRVRPEDVVEKTRSLVQELETARKEIATHKKRIAEFDNDHDYHMYKRQKERKFTLDDLNHEQRELVNNLQDIPPNAGFERMDTFNAKDGTCMVVLGYDRKRQSFPVVCTEKFRLEDVFAKSTWKYYRTDFVCEQIGDMKLLRQSRCQKFWNWYGSSPMPLTYAYLGKIYDVEIVDVRPGGCKRPLVLLLDGKAKINVSMNEETRRKFQER